MDYIYADSEIEFIKYIKKIPPKKIWWDFTTYVFDYDNLYYQIECVAEIADTINNFDEAMIGQITKRVEPFVPLKHTKLICENKFIEDLFIVRTFLYFTTFKTFTKTEKYLKRIRLKLKTFLTGKKEFFESLASQASGGYEAIICHPKSEEAKKIDHKFSNLIDCGLLLQIEGQYLKAFVEDNGFGFNSDNNKFFFDINELKEISENYEFIKI
jgi:hypothetical protein